MHITVRCLRCTSANHLVLQSEQSRAIWLSHFRLTNSHFLAKTREYEKTCPQCRTAGYLVPCANNSAANPSMLVFGLDNLWCLKPKPQRLRPSRVSSGFPPALLKCVFCRGGQKAWLVCGSWGLDFRTAAADQTTGCETWMHLLSPTKL